MPKKRLVMKNEVTFEIDGNLVGNTSTFKEAMDNGCVEVVGFNVELINENGEKYDDSTFLDLVKDAIIYGLLERV